MQQFVYYLNCMRTAIPLFSKKVAPIQLILEMVYEAAKEKGTEKSADKVKLQSVGCSKVHEVEFGNCKMASEQEMTLAHLDKDQRICLSTDTSQDILEK